MKSVTAIFIFVSFVVAFDIAEASRHSGGSQAARVLAPILLVFLMGGLVYYFASRKNLPEKKSYTIQAVAWLIITPFFIPLLGLAMALIILLIIGFKDYRCSACQSVVKGGKNEKCGECGHIGPAPNLAK